MANVLLAGYERGEVTPLQYRLKMDQTLEVAMMHYRRLPNGVVIL